MRGEELLVLFGDIDARYIEDAARGSSVGAHLRRLGAAATTAAVVIGALHAAGVFGGTVAPAVRVHPETGLPLLSVAEPNAPGGFEADLAYDISEYVNGAPWTTETALSTLPVYRNVKYSDRTEEEQQTMMETYLLELAGRLGLEEGTYTVAPQERTSSLMLYADGIEIWLDSMMTARITFEPALVLSEGYNVPTHGANCGTYEEILSAAGYLRETYAELLDMDQPIPNIMGGFYDFNGEQHYDISFYEGGGDVSQQIVACEFQSVTFFTGYDGSLSLIVLHNEDLSQKAGDYPVISWEEAMELLLAGNFITTVYDDIPAPTEDRVETVDIVYRFSAGNEYYMPYYCFRVELPEMEVGDLHRYGRYYVPAVEEEYLVEMPVWDGSLF